MVDAELTRGQKRLAAVGLAALLVAVGAGVAFAAPLKTFTAGNTLTAADLNSNFADVPTVTEWASYTPVVTQANGGSTLTPTGSAMWRRVGDTLEVSIDETFPTCNAGAPLQWSLPPNLAPDSTKLPSNNALVGTAMSNTAAFSQIASGGVLAQLPLALVGAQEGQTPLGCSAIGNGGEVRMTFAIPIQGWQFNN